MAEFTATVDDTAALTDSVAGEVEFARVIDESAVVVDLVLGDMDFLRAVVDTVAQTDALDLEAGTARVTSDSVLVTDAVASASVIAKSFSDAVSLSDDVDVKSLIVQDSIAVTDQLVSALATLNVIVNDEVDTPDQIASFTSTVGAFVLGDVLTVTDSVGRGLTRSVTRSDDIATTEQLKRTAFYGRVLSDAASIADALTSTPTLAYAISEAHALSETRVRVTFAAPALNDAALSNPANYVFQNLSAGTVDITPTAVFIPPGQSQPLYVEIDTSEHTDAGTYQVALTSAIRGAAGEYGDGVPYPYVGIGVAPQLAVVIATSPTEAEVHFTEAIANNVDARSKFNYTWSGGLQTIEVLSVIGEVVTLRTTAQVPGTLYTLTVTANEPIAADIQISDSVAVVDALASKLEPIRVEVSDELVDGVADSIATQLSRHLSLAVGSYYAPVSQNAGVQSSLDAVTWDDESAFPQQMFVYPYRASFGNDQNVVVASPNVYRSVGDGIWNTSVLSDVNGIGFSPDLGIFVVGGANQFYVSTDAENWTAYPADVPSGTVYFWSVAWSPSLGLFVAGGNSSEYFQTSPDGMTWTRHAQGGGFNLGLWWGIAWNEGAGLFGAAGGNSAAADPLQTSPDGVNWTPRTPGGGYSGYWNSIAASATRFVIVGYDSAPQVQTSDDGITWTPRTFAGSYTGTPNGVAYRADLGLFIMCGTAAEIQTSPDGVTWTHRAVGGGVTDANFRGAA